MKKISLPTLAFFLNISLWISLLSVSVVHSAPRIPAQVLNNGLVYCTGDVGNTLRPQSATELSGDNIVTAQIYNRLFRLQGTSMKILPELATGYRFSDDGKSLTLYLRHGVKFQHTPYFTPSRDFNATDVVFSLNRMLGREVHFSVENTPTRYSNLQNQIYHQQVHFAHPSYFAQIKLNENVQSIQAKGEWEVQIRLFTPDNNILSHLASPYAVMMSQEYAQQLAREDNLADLESFPVGTGAYKMKSYFRNQYVRLIRNEHYWGNKAKIAHIVVNLANNQSGRLLKFLNNECQIADALELSQLKILEKNKHKNYYEKEVYGMNLLYLAFNFQRPAMQDETLRRAIAQAINRKRLVERLYYGNAQIADQIIPKNAWTFRPPVQGFHHYYHPDDAKRVLSPRHLTLNLWVVNEESIFNPSPIESAELIQRDLNQAGVQVKIRYITRQFLHQSLEKGKADYDLILTGWISRRLEPEIFMQAVLSCRTQHTLTNLSHWCNTDFDDKLQQALLSPRTEWYRLYHQAQDIALRELPIIPLANARHILVVNNRVQGLNLQLVDHLQFSTLSLKQEAR